MKRPRGLPRTLSFPVPYPGIWQKKIIPWKEISMESTTHIEALHNNIIGSEYQIHGIAILRSALEAIALSTRAVMWLRFRDFPREYPTFNFCFPSLVLATGMALSDRPLYLLVVFH